MELTLGRLVTGTALVLSLLVSASLAEEIEVETSNGFLRGNSGLTRLNRMYFSFKGIPYGKPPVGELRFESPQPAQNWTGTRDAFNFGSSCPQWGSGNEDCLYLNVYSPKFDNGFSPTPLPVLFFIHGGFYQGGAGTGSPGYFLDEDVLLVNINYRLNSFGFLNTGDGVVRGNMGLKDMTLALKWVQENIHRFGGDPSRVTIFGHSAGGSAVHYLMLSPQTKGLFSRAISQSGTAHKPWSFQPRPYASATLLAIRLGCIFRNTTDMVACLKTKDAQEIAKLSSRSGGAVKIDLEVFCPSVEAVQDEDAFLTKHPHDVVVDGEAHRLPWIAGVTNGEGRLYIDPIRGNPELVGDVNTKWEVKAPEYLHYNLSQTYVTTAITDFYLQGGPIDFEGKLLDFATLWSDRLYITFARHAAVHQAKHAPVYLYYFEYLNNENSYAAGHGEEQFLLWPSGVNPGSKHYEMSRDLVRLWVDFASGVTPLNFQGNTWQPIDVSGRDPVQYLVFNNQRNAILPDPIESRVRFWDQLDMYRLGGRDL